jgi:hypothetical protein
MVLKGTYAEAAAIEARSASRNAGAGASTQLGLGMRALGRRKPSAVNPFGRTCFAATHIAPSGRCLMRRMPA